MKRLTTMALFAGASCFALTAGAMAQDGTGFSISINGQTVAGDTTVKKQARRADEQLKKADLRVQFDGLGVRPRLTAEVLGGGRPRAGQSLRVKSALNYPAFVTRAEMRVIDLGAAGRPRTLEVVHVAPNGIATITMPEGDGIAVVHRVYDAHGRYDETAPILLANVGERGGQGDLAGLEEDGTDSAVRRRISIVGGAVTVSGSSVRQGATVETLGERVRPDADGDFVIQRILPAGTYPVEVRVSGAGENSYVLREIDIPRFDWFGTGIIDVTFGRRFEGGAAAAGGAFDRTYSYGRIAGYATGKTASGWNLTGRVDTGEDDLDNLLRGLDEKDPMSLLLRMQRERGYPTYGDDSTLVDGAPSDGKVYLKAEKDGSHILWGNYKSAITGSTYLRNERTLYGLQGVYRSKETTAQGEARVSAEVFAASPDRIPGRDQFLGTGGSVYFLQRQDIGLGSETLTIQLRDPDTGRVVETRTLTYGRDYEINYIQGVVTLTAPLSGSVGGGTVVTTPGGEYEAYLVAQYEYTPTATDVDGMSYGGRVEAWASDRLRFGVTAAVENTDFADQKMRGFDLLYQVSEQSFVELEYANTSGPGFGSSVSSDGGMIVDNTAGVGGDGSAYLVRGQLEFADLGLQTKGRVSAYWEKREAGFSSLDYQITDTEELYGFALEGEPNTALRYKLYADVYKNGSGKQFTEAGAELHYGVNDRVDLAFGVEHIDKVTPGGAADETGSRTDVAVKATFTESDALKWHVFGQATAAHSGGLSKNNRLGLGVDYGFANGWKFKGEISDGSLGFAAEALFAYESDGYDSRYIGYRLDPDREFAGVNLSGRDRGQFVLGGKRRVREDVDIFGENTYDMFGQHRSLTSAYGVEYRRSDYLTYSANFEIGQISDAINGDFDRNAVSFGLRYEDPNGLSARARLEMRRDRGVTSGTVRDADAFLFAAQASYKISDEKRLLFAVEHSDTQSDQSSILDGEYTDVSLGYAFRPILDDKLNLLLQYRYFRDMVGQRIDGTDQLGPRQESHVFSLDADYDLNERWTIGGKLGVRVSNSSPSDTVGFAQNDAYLAVINARYHLVHNWDVLLEARHLEAEQAGISETSILGAAYRHVGQNLKIGVGYNFGTFSDDLTDLTYDDKGVFINLIAKF